jgi:transposase InsO family protein
MSRGFMDLAVIMDWHCRCVLSWRLSNTLDALEGALSMGVPGIFNTDQGSQFISEAFTSVLMNRGVQISMDSASGLRGQRVRRTAVEGREARGGAPKSIRECGKRPEQGLEPT